MRCAALVMSFFPICLAVFPPLRDPRRLSTTNLPAYTLVYLCCSSLCKSQSWRGEQGPNLEAADWTRAQLYNLKYLGWFSCNEVLIVEVDE